MQIHYWTPSGEGLHRPAAYQTASTGACGLGGSGAVRPFRPGLPKSDSRAGQQGHLRITDWPTRIYYTVLDGETMVLLGGSKKDDQDREVRACAQRIKDFRERAK